MNEQFKDALFDSPIIAAIKDDEGLERCLLCDAKIIFVLYGDILTIPSIVERINEKNKLAFVHVDLISGLYSCEVAVDFIKTKTRASGIISTKSQVILRAKELGLYTVMRFFVIDSMAISNIEKQMKQAKPDVIEVMPALMPKIVAKIVSKVKCPVIGGGLVSDKEDVYSVLNAGATAISSTNRDVWFE
ncbi:MAG: glycerol-3-phosphate responsive antiterminator [Lachnospiraceae bacterium]|nr:glycerol-3-phosphate responsive antiterminator [Lachnospiraceae bacterium]